MEQLTIALPTTDQTPEDSIRHVPYRRPFPPCPHPAAAQIVTLNLFSGASDKVCADCNATIVPNWHPPQS